MQLSKLLPTFLPFANTVDLFLQTLGLQQHLLHFPQWQHLPFCHEGKDITCPLPLCAKPSRSTRNSPVPPSPSTHNSPARPLMSHQSSDQPPPLKKQRLQRICGKCGHPGHNSCTCVVKYNIYSTITYLSHLFHNHLSLFLATYLTDMLLFIPFHPFCYIPCTLTLQLSLIHYHHRTHYYFTHCMAIASLPTHFNLLFIFYMFRVEHFSHFTEVSLYI